MASKFGDMNSAIKRMEGEIKTEKKKKTIFRCLSVILPMHSHAGNWDSFTESKDTIFDRIPHKQVFKKVQKLNT